MVVMVLVMVMLVVVVVVEFVVVVLMVLVVVATTISIHNTTYIANTKMKAYLYGFEPHSSAYFFPSA